MKKLKAISNHKSLRPVKVNYSKKELLALATPAVSRATNAALDAWKSIKKDSLAFAAKLERVRRVMVKGNSPKSLFSKWLRESGIPRSTAYWYLSGGTKPTGKRSRKQSIRSQFIESLKDKSPEKVREELVGVWKRLNLNAGPLIPKGKPFNLAEQLKSEKGFGASVGEWLQSNQRMLTRMTAPQLEVFKSQLTAPKKPAASVPADHRQHAQA